MRTLARLAVTAALILMSTPGSAGAQAGSWTRQPKDKKESADLREYDGLVRAFRSGDDAPADQIASWPNKRILAVVGLLPPAPLDFAPWDPGQFKAAAMLHTTVAVHLLETPGRIEGSLFHLEVATDVLRRSRVGMQGFVGAWHTAVVRMLLARSRLAPVDAFLEHAREQFPDEPAILFLSGLLSEYLAGPSSFEELAVVPPVMSVAKMQQAFERISQRRTGRLNDAARWIRAGLAPDPGDAEILLHLGRVEMLREHDADALRLLREVAGSARAGADLKYLAALFEGGLHERAGRTDDAVASYRLATTVAPGAQTARVALSEALRRAGRGDQSRDVLREALAHPLRRIVEPWWSYFIEDSAVTSSRLNKLLAEARR